MRQDLILMAIYRDSLGANESHLHYISLNTTLSLHFAEGDHIFTKATLQFLGPKGCLLLP